MAQCMYPYHVENSNYFKQEDRTIPVPCGRCPECMKRRIAQWGFRLKKEEERSKTAFFVTLTYDTTTVPISSNGFMTLNKRDVQLFFKRLRKLHSSPSLPIKYYAVGEYGTQKKRPHYHLIIFNAQELDIMKAWVQPYENAPIGNVHIDVCNGATIGYTLSYIIQGKWYPMHKNDDRIPEFSLMSKGLGKNFLTPKIVDYHRNNLDKAYLTLEGGIRMSLPRYYKEKIFPVTIPAVLHKEENFLLLNPSILTHIYDNEHLKKQQNEIVKLAISLEPQSSQTDYEKHESRKAAIHHYKKFHGKRSDI